MPEAQSTQAPQAPQATKVCKTCGEPKTLDNFWKHRTSRDGLRPHCKPCSVERRKKRAQIRNERTQGDEADENRWALQSQGASILRMGIVDKDGVWHGVE